MKSTDIPNGIIFRDLKGAPLLMDFDDYGKLMEEVFELERKPNGVGSRGKDDYGSTGLDVLTFVHTVKGASAILMKSLYFISLKGKGKGHVYGLLKNGELFKLANEIRSGYIKEMERL